jgi:hypothetical protein
VHTGGTLECLIVGDVAPNMTEEQTVPSGTFKGVATFGTTSSFWRTCGIHADDDTVECWGPISGGITPTGAFMALSMGDSGSCGLRTDGTIACWDQDSLLPDPPSGTFIRISLAANNACALATDGTLACWGDNTAATPPSGTFIDVSLDDVAPARDAPCAVQTDGNIVCWGAVVRPDQG